MKTIKTPVQLKKFPNQTVILTDADKIDPQHSDNIDDIQLYFFKDHMWFGKADLVLYIDYKGQYKILKSRLPIIIGK